MKKNSNITLDKLFETYIKKCNIKNLSPRTIKSYTSDYNIFANFIDGSTLTSQINSDTIDDFIIHLRNNTNAKGITINSYLRSIRAFLYFGMEGGYITRFTVHLPKVEKPIKETYTEEELRLLLKKPDIKNCTFKEYQMWVYSNYLLATGNRISSVLSIKIKDLDFNNSLIRINKMKNRKSQIIPMSKTLSSILQEYLTYRGGESDDYVFCTVTGEKASIRTYQDSLKHYNQSRGVVKTSSHLYRHTFAKQWILNGGDIFRLQKMLGHSDLSVVKEYVNMFSDELSIDFEKFNPLDNLGINQEKKHIGMRRE